MEEIFNEEVKKFEDKTLPIKERQDDYNTRMETMMNPLPVEDFDPSTFEPHGEEMRVVANRSRKKPNKVLETYGLEPKEFRIGQMIGMYESKQDLYLLFAHRCNDLQDEIDALKIQIEKLTK